MRKTGQEVWAGRWRVTESPPLSVFGCEGLRLIGRSTSLEGKKDTKIMTIFLILEWS